MHSPTMTYDQYLGLPEPEWHTEWVDGAVVPLPAVSNEHTAIQVFLLTVLNTLIEHRRLGILLARPFQMKTGPDLPGRAPDLMFVSNHSVHRLKGCFLDGPADLAIEVVGDESRVRDRLHKFAEYESGGVPELWLVDPVRRAAEFFRRGRSGKYRAVPSDADGTFRSDAVPGAWLKVEWFWNPPSTIDVLRAWGVV